MVTMRSPSEALLACSSARSDATERLALRMLVGAVRRDAPSLDVRDVPADLLASDSAGPPVRVAVPLTLTEGGDVGAALSIAARNDPTLVVARALGPDWALAEVCVQRLVEAGARKGDSIVLGVAGSHDDATIAGYSRAAQLVSAVWGGPVHIGSVGGRDTPLTDAVDIARAYGRRVVVASYVLTPGRSAEMFRHVGGDLVTEPLIGGGVPDPRVVSLVVSRFHQALGVGVPSLR